MGEYYIGEIRIFPYTFAPAEDWLECNGQVLNSAQYQTLYAVIGNLYGGTAPNTFALPDLRGRAPVGVGSIPGGQAVYQQGKAQGAVTTSLTSAQMPGHAHALNAKLGDSAQPPGQAMYLSDPGGADLGVYMTRSNSSTNYAIKPAFSDVPPSGMTLGASALTPAGVSPASHENRQPNLAFRFCICVQGGVFPVRP